jgi:uncharacterized protein (TIGR01777 family)
MGLHLTAGEQMVNILITGSTGLIGSALVQSLRASGYEPIPLSRNPLMEGPYWNPETGEIQLPQQINIDAVIHLSGENIARGRWSSRKKALIRNSRINSTILLVQAITNLRALPKILISASGIGIYGDRGNRIMDEDNTPGAGFLADVSRDWEAATRPAVEAGIRVVNLRLGLVMSKQGGILGRMLLPFKCGLGASMGSGDQYMSWIAIDDLIRAINHIMVNERIRGPVNLVSPNPVSNKEFTSTLARVLHRPAILRIPAFAVRILYGEMGKEVLLSSTRAFPRRLTSSGFEFRFPLLEGALQHVLEQ